MPKLAKIEIAYYRGFYQSQTIDFAQPTGALGSGLTILVGPNNSGKTSVVNAMRAIVVGAKQVDLEHRHPNNPLKITATDTDGATKSLTNPDGGAATQIQGNPNVQPSSAHFRYVPSRRAWNAYTSNQRIAQQSYWSQNDFFSATVNDDFLIGRLGALSAQGKSDFNALLKTILPQLESWRLELSRGQSYIRYETKSGAVHASDLFGDGMASLFRIGLALFDSNVDDIVVIDEPELSLHPQGQKTLAAALSKFSEDRQVVITTHSPYFVNWTDLTNGAVVYRLSQLVSGVVANRLPAATVTEINRLTDDWQKPHLLDAVAREIFFADEVIFFEGQEDVGLVQKFSSDRGLGSVSAFGYGAAGFGNIQIFLRMAKDLGIKAAAVYDGDHEAEQRVASQNFPESLIKLLPTPDIRDKEEDGRVVKEGIFDRRGVIKPERVEYLSGLLREVRAYFDGAAVQRNGVLCLIATKVLSFFS